jgi:hypothetical protein
MMATMVTTANQTVLAMAARLSLRFLVQKGTNRAAIQLHSS